MNMKKIKKLIEFHIVVVGSYKCGKTQIISRFIDNSFHTYSPATTWIDSQFKKVKMEDGIEVKVKIYDTPGRENYKNIATNYIIKADGIIINYDITDKQSFNEVEYYWINEIKERYLLKEKIVFIVGNKTDLEDNRVISKEEGEKLAEKYEVMFYECSAKTGENVDFIFNELIKICYSSTEKRKEEKKGREEKEEKRRREIEEEKLKKNLKILNKYLSF